MGNDCKRSTFCQPGDISLSCEHHLLDLKLLISGDLNTLVFQQLPGAPVQPRPIAPRHDTCIAKNGVISEVLRHDCTVLTVHGAHERTLHQGKCLDNKARILLT